MTKVSWTSIPSCLPSFPPSLPYLIVFQNSIPSEKTLHYWVFGSQHFIQMSCFHIKKFRVLRQMPHRTSRGQNIGGMTLVHGWLEMWRTNQGSVGMIELHSNDPGKGQLPMMNNHIPGKKNPQRHCCDKKTRTTLYCICTTIPCQSLYLVLCIQSFVINVHMEKI